MLVVDTNVLVHAADTSAREHAACRRHLETWRRGATPWYFTWSIVYEFLRVVTHPRVFRRPWTAVAAWGFIDVLLSSPSSEILMAGDRHASMLAELITATPALEGNLFHDAHVVALMRENGVKTIYTRNSDFYRFAGIEVVDPL